MRGEDWRVAGGGPAGGEEEAEAAGETCGWVYPRSYSGTTAFGWVFPRTKTRRHGVIDTVWLREFSRDIEILQSEIKRQTTFAYSDEKITRQEDSLQTDYGSECRAAAMNCTDRVSTPEMTASARVSVNFSAVESRGLDHSEGNLGVCYSDQGAAKVKVQGSTHNWESAGSEKSFASDSRFNTYAAAGGKSDEYSSMQSDASRDSGVFSTDDASIVSEAPGDKSLLEEIGDVLGDQDLSLEPCLQCGSLPLEEMMPARQESASRPVWMARFSNSKELLAAWGSQEWEVGHSPLTCIRPVTRRDTCDSEDSGSHVTPTTPLSDEEEGLKVKQCIACEQLNEKSPVSHPPPLQHISELAKFTHSFQGISARVENLRSGLQCLTGEVNESKRDYISLEERTAKLLASTVTYRRRLTRVRALELLEDRLHEEWWDAYDPTGVSFHDNYIV